MTRQEFEALFEEDHEDPSETGTESASKEVSEGKEDTDTTVSDEKVSSEETESSDK